MILGVSWIFHVQRIYLFEFGICLNGAQFLGKNMVLSTKEAPKPASSGGFDWEKKINCASGPSFLLALPHVLLPSPGFILVNTINKHILIPFIEPY